MGLYKLLFVQLSQDLWNRATIPNNEFIFDVPHENANVGKCSKWQSFDRFQGEFFDGSRAFACTLVTEDFKELASNYYPNDGLDDANAMALIGRLFRVLGISASCERANPTVTPPLIDLFNPVGDLGGYDCLYQIDDGINGGNRWRGAWSTLVPYWNQQDYDEIMAPMAPIEDPDNPKLFFAGEAYCPVWVGFQHGAWDSGRLQAREMLFELNQFQDTDKDEWKRYSDAFLTSPRCDIPDGVTPPIRKSKTVP
jgi:Flavin containing amine oxidoreductase